MYSALRKFVCLFVLLGDLIFFCSNFMNDFRFRLVSYGDNCCWYNLWIICFCCVGQELYGSASKHATCNIQADLISI